MGTAHNSGTDGAGRRGSRAPKCPIRYGFPCTACQPGASGPQDCQLVMLVREDPELKELMKEMIAKHRQN
ncbi:DUF6767 domain-containing protein [Corynebacterium aquilae]|uniref:DUF6767 domain-containing protein n=1 Tax=Corynebacterium aquilae TaxID=203263 RepID=UPI000950EAE4|nr:DUF6767 domain-containing protein [Corynebacterium aquilae]